MAERVIFHIDVNSAFLSWTACYRCRVLGQELDLRAVPSVVTAAREFSSESIRLRKSAAS